MSAHPTPQSSRSPWPTSSIVIIVALLVLLTYTTHHLIISKSEKEADNTSDLEILCWHIEKNGDSQCFMLTDIGWMPFQPLDRPDVLMGMSQEDRELISSMSMQFFMIMKPLKDAVGTREVLAEWFVLQPVSPASHNFNTREHFPRQSN